MKCGLLGRKLGHSYSPQIHTFFGNYPYVLHEKEPEELSDFLLHGDFTAINVTIPYKKDVIPYCSALSDTAKRMGAVNTIIRKKDGTLLGHNTDYFGFTFMVHKSGLNPVGKKAIVLGSGGASNTAVAVLQDMGADVIVISHKDNTPDNIQKHSDAKIIVNATPVGMYPNNGLSPVDLAFFPTLEGVLDMIYNPSRTKLLMDAANRNLIAENGLWMLIAQAKEAAEWFTGNIFSSDIIAKIHGILSTQMENIALIGMPGCGKSTVGALLAKQLHREFVDADKVIEKMAEKAIPEIFAESGEDGFRRWETKTLTELGKQSGLVIATGGGCVTRPENYSLLHQNSTIFWLQRDLNILPTDGRPLSKAGRLEAMYEVRRPLYAEFADLTVINNKTPEEAAKQIAVLLSQEDAQ